MKKLLTLFVAAVFVLTQMTAQDPVFKDGDKVLNLGIGLGSSWYSGSYYSMTFPPLNASFEVGVKDGVLEKGSIGVGGMMGYSGYKYEYTDWKWVYSNFLLGARGYFHYPLAAKLDTYTGLMLGYNIATEKWKGTGSEPTDYETWGGFVWSWFIGGRYYIKENFALMAELGYGSYYVNLGVAFRL
ncbi:MAG: hypothetical protein MUD02_10550 [Bacteroidales bacterium]|jgi:hypothetical protein|nr:hypothetical protein [Bacteroidales bacterium]MCU0409376.1 hypothetical protein [Bacteroidales bacterium]